MSAAEKLLELYLAWRELSTAEAAGLRVGNWDAVAKAQEAKTLLQPLISELSEALPVELLQTGSPVQTRTRIRQILEELIELEESNAKLLDTQHEELKRRQVEISLSHRNLNRVQRSYGQSNPVNWQSYS